MSELHVASNQAQPLYVDMVTTGFESRRHHINKGWAWFEANERACLGATFLTDIVPNITVSCKSLTACVRACLCL